MDIMTIIAYMCFVAWAAMYGWAFPRTALLTVAGALGLWFGWTFPAIACVGLIIAIIGVGIYMFMGDRK